MSRQIVPRRVSGIHGRAGCDTVDETSTMASGLFDQYCSANTFASIMSTFHQLCDCLELKPSDHQNFYYALKSRLQTWRAQSLWAKLDKRAQHREYKKGKACANTRVLIIGGGPCGLRLAIEVALLGGKAVVVEKRDRFSRNNVLHLWPFVIHDLKALGAKKFFGKFCTGAVDHISIRTLQCILLKVALLVGVEVHPNVSFDELLEPPCDQANEKVGWRALMTPRDHAVSEYEFDVIFGADGKRNTLHGFKRKEFRGKLAIAITANFINRNSNAEARVEEISGVAFIFNQKFFKDLNQKTGIDLENIVYYKDETHYFVMTAKKQSLLSKGVLIHDFMDTARLLSQDNVNQEALLNYATEAADVSTRHQLPHVDYAHNHYGQPDVAMFDFTSIYAAEHASRVIERNGHKVLMGLCGDSLMEPFWPTGSGCARGFLGALDASWMIRSWVSGRYTPLEVIAERESIYQLLSQTTPENLSKNFNMYSIDPCTRYPNVNTAHFKPFQVRHQYDGEDTKYLDQIVQISEQKSKRYEWIRDSHYLQKWFARQLESYANLVKILDLTSSWRNGLALCALIHKYRPELIDVYKLDPNEVEKNNQMAFDIALKEFGICPVMSGADMAGCEVPDKLTMVSYLSHFFEYFRKESIRPAKVARSPDQLPLPRSMRPHARSPAQRLSILSRISNRMRARKLGLLYRQYQIWSSSEELGYNFEEEEEDGSMETERIRPTLTFTQGHARKRIHEDAAQDSENVVLQGYTKFEGGLGAEPGYKFTKPTESAKLGPGARGKNKVTALAKGLAHKLKGERSPPTAKKTPAAPKPLIMGQAAGADHCYFCKLRVYLVERHAAEGVFFHRGCLKCEFCYSNLRIGQYGFKRTEDGEAKFYCIQHIGMTRPMRRLRKRNKDQEVPGGEEDMDLETPDSKPSVPEAEVEAVAKPARVRELSGSNALSESSDGAAEPGLDKTPERIEYYTESEVEESEFEQTAHNLSASLLDVQRGESGSESEEDLFFINQNILNTLGSSSDELEWSDGELSDGDASWAQIAVSYNKLNKLRKERRVARRATRVRQAAGSGSDTETPGSSDNNWQSESETEKESEGEESDEEIRRRNRRHGVPFTSTPDQERGYQPHSHQGGSPYGAGPLRSPPIEYEEKEPSQAATAILKNRMSFFSAVTEPVRIDPFSFLGLSPAPNIAQGDSLLEKAEPKESTEEEEEPQPEIKPEEDQGKKSAEEEEEEEAESDSSLSETDTITEGSESEEEDQTGLVRRVHHPIPTISIEEVDMVQIASDSEPEQETVAEKELNPDEKLEREEPVEEESRAKDDEAEAKLFDGEPRKAISDDLQHEVFGGEPKKAVGADLQDEVLGGEPSKAVGADLQDEVLGGEPSKAVSANLQDEVLGGEPRKAVSADLQDEVLGGEPRKAVGADLQDEVLGGEPSKAVGADLQDEVLGGEPRKAVGADLQDEVLGGEPRKAVSADLQDEVLGGEPRKAVSADLQDEVLGDEPGKAVNDNLQDEVLGREPKKAVRADLQDEALGEEPKKAVSVDLQDEVLGGKPGKAINLDLQAELDLMELEVEIMKKSVGDKIVKLAKVNDTVQGAEDSPLEQAIIDVQDAATDILINLDTDLSEAATTSEPMPATDEHLFIKSANQDLMKEIIAIKSEPFDLPVDSITGPPKRTSSSELESFENIEKILRQASEDQNTDVDMGEGMPSEEIVDDWINSSWAASAAATATAPAEDKNSHKNKIEESIPVSPSMPVSLAEEVKKVSSQIPNFWGMDITPTQETSLSDMIILQPTSIQQPMTEHSAKDAEVAPMVSEQPVVAHDITPTQDHLPSEVPTVAHGGHSPTDEAVLQKASPQSPSIEPPCELLLETGPEVSTKTTSLSDAPTREVYDVSSEQALGERNSPEPLVIDQLGSTVPTDTAAVQEKQSFVTDKRLETQIPPEAPEMDLVAPAEDVLLADTAVIQDKQPLERQIPSGPPEDELMAPVEDMLPVTKPAVPDSLPLITDHAFRKQIPVKSPEKGSLDHVEPSTNKAPIAYMEDMPFEDEELEASVGFGAVSEEVAFSEVEIQSMFAPVAAIQEIVPPEEVANRVAEVLPFTVSKIEEQEEIDLPSSWYSCSPKIMTDLGLSEEKDMKRQKKGEEKKHGNVIAFMDQEEETPKVSLAEQIERELQEDEVLQIIQKGDEISNIEMLPTQPKAEPLLEEAVETQRLPPLSEKLNKKVDLMPISASEESLLSKGKVDRKMRGPVVSVDDMKSLPSPETKTTQASKAKLKKGDTRKLLTQVKVLKDTDVKLRRQMSAPEPETTKTKPNNANSKPIAKRKVEYVKVPKIRPLSIPNDVPLAEAAAAAARARLSGRPLSMTAKTKFEKEEEVTRRLREEHRKSRLQKEQEEQQAEELHKKRKEELRKLREEDAQRKKELEEARKRREEEAKRLREEVRRKEEALERKRAAERGSVQQVEHLEAWKQGEAIQRIDDLLDGLRGPHQSKGDTLKSLAHTHPEDIGELAQELMAASDVKGMKSEMSQNGNANFQKQPKQSGDGKAENIQLFHVDEAFVTTRDKRKRKRNMSNQSDSSFTISTPSGSVKSVSSISEIESTLNSLGASLDTGSFDQLGTTSESVGENISLDGLLDVQGEHIEESKTLFRSKSADAEVTLQDVSALDDSSLHTAESSVQESRSANTTSADESQYFTPNVSLLEPGDTDGKPSIRRLKAKSLTDAVSNTSSDRKSVDSLASDRSSSPLYSPGKAQLLTDAKRKFFYEMSQPVHIDPKQMFSDLRSPQGKHHKKTLLKSLTQQSEGAAELANPADAELKDGESTAAEKMKEWKSMDAGVSKKVGGLELARDWQSMDSTALQSLSPTAGVPKTNIVNGEASNDVFYTPATSMKSRPPPVEDEERSSFKKPHAKKKLLSNSPKGDPRKKAYTAAELKMLRETEREKMRLEARERARMLSDEDLGIEDKPTLYGKIGEPSTDIKEASQQRKGKGVSKDLRADISKLISKPLPSQLQKIEDNVRHERMGSDSSSRSGGSGSHRTTSETSTYGSTESPRPHAFSDGASDHSDHSPALSHRDEIKEKTKSLDRAKLKKRTLENKQQQEEKGKGSEKKEKRRSFLAMLLPKKDKDKGKDKDKEDKKEKKTPTEKKPVSKLRSKMKTPKSAEKEKEKEANRDSLYTDEFNPFFEDAYGLEVKERGKLKERLEQMAPVASKSLPKPKMAPKATVEEFDTESELGDDRVSVRSFQSQIGGMSEEDQARYLKKQQKAAVKRHREQELKRLRMAQEIQRQLEEVEIKQRQVEMRGIAIERALRGEGPDATRNEADLMQEWFNVVHEKNVLVRYESELMVHARELELEDRHSRLEQQLRDRMSISEGDLSPSQKQEEQRILEELLEVVEQRDSLVALLEEDRLRLREEEKRKKIAISNR